MKKYNTFQKTLICVCPFLLVFVLYFAACFIIDRVTLPECFTYRFLGVYCPSCGITRSIIALVNGDIILSLRQNIMTVMIIAASALYYIEFALRAIGKNIRFPLIHNIRTLYVLMIFMAVYTVARNIFPVLAPF